AVVVARLGARLAVLTRLVAFAGSLFLAAAFGASFAGALVLRVPVAGLTAGRLRRFFRVVGLVVLTRRAVGGGGGALGVGFRIPAPRNLAANLADGLASRTLGRCGGLARSFVRLRCVIRTIRSVLRRRFGH